MGEVERLLILSVASFLASLLSACFSVGGGYILFGATTWLLPLQSAIALQSVLSFGSLFSRTHAFWREIDWPIVRLFTAGSLVGIGIGLWVFTRAPAHLLALLLGVLLLLLAWAPALRLRLPEGGSFFATGIAHAVTATIFGLGAILQPVLLRTRLSRTAIVGTFATCIILLELLRTGGYFAAGFDYTRYWGEILAATVTGLAGTYIGKRMTPMVSEATFRFVMRLFISALGVRFLVQGIGR